MARTVDHISDGRLILGIGSGWFERDYDEYGYEFGTAGGRLDALDRDLPLISERAGPGSTRRPTRAHPGAHRRRRRAQDAADRRPARRHLARLRRRRRRSRTSTRVLDEWCAQGRAATRPRSSARPASRPTDAAARAPRALYAVGTRLFTVGLGGPDYDLGAVRDLVAWRDETNEADGRRLSGACRCADRPPTRRETLLVTISGDDRPGVTSALFDAIADVGAEVLDLEQVVVRGHLTLAMLLAAGPRRRPAALGRPRRRVGARHGRQGPAPAPATTPPRAAAARPSSSSAPRCSPAPSPP